MENPSNNDFEIFSKIHCFIDSQIRQIRNGGISVLMRKIGKSVVFVIRCILAVPSALVIFLLRPLLLVRFVKLDTERIGHFTSMMEMYFYGRSIGLHPEKKFDVFYHGSNVCNVQLRKMLSLKVFVFPFLKFAWYLDSVVFLLCNCFLDGKRHVIILKEDLPNTFCDLYCLPPCLDFSKEEKKHAEGELQKIGVPSDAQYVCIYGRDSAYLNKTIPSWNWEHHDIRDNDIQSYISMAENLLEKISNITVFCAILNIFSIIRFKYSEALS